MRYWFAISRVCKYGALRYLDIFNRSKVSPSSRSHKKIQSRTESINMVISPNKYRHVQRNLYSCTQFIGTWRSFVRRYTCTRVHDQWYLKDSFFRTNGYTSKFYEERTSVYRDRASIREQRTRERETEIRNRVTKDWYVMVPSCVSEWTRYTRYNGLATCWSLVDINNRCIFAFRCCFLRDLW